MNIMILLFQFRLAYVAPESRVVGADDLVDEPKKIAVHYLRGYFLLDFFVVLPLPQVTKTFYIDTSRFRYRASSSHFLHTKKSREIT